MNKKEKILNQYSIDHHHEGIILQENWFDYAAEDIVKLFSIPVVTNGALRAKVEKLEKENEFLRFMVDNGLGEEDLKNDITLPHDI